MNFLSNGRKFLWGGTILLRGSLSPSWLLWTSQCRRLTDRQADSKSSPHPPTAQDKSHTQIFCNLSDTINRMKNIWYYSLWKWSPWAHLVPGFGTHPCKVGAIQSGRLTDQETTRKDENTGNWTNYKFKRKKKWGKKSHKFRRKKP